MDSMPALEIKIPPGVLHVITTNQHQLFMAQQLMGGERLMFLFKEARVLSPGMILLVVRIQILRFGMR